jgi:hypothetical protein
LIPQPLSCDGRWSACGRLDAGPAARLAFRADLANAMLVVLRVPLPAVMEIMSWSDPSIAKRYMHVTDELMTTIGPTTSANCCGPSVWRAAETEMANVNQRGRQTPGGRRLGWSERRMRDLNPRGAINPNTISNRAP